MNVLCVATEKFGKLNQRKISVSGFLGAERVTTQKCFKYSYTLMLKQNLGWVMGKTELTEKFRKLNQRKISVSGFLSAERSPRKNVLSIATH